MKSKGLILILCLLLVSLYVLPAAADGSPLPVLTSLTHNCPNTGKMLPEKFDPNTNEYILTVASWVSRVNFTPTAEYGTSITVNGQYIASGSTTSYFQMTDEPQMVQITLSRYGVSNTYTIFLQRRPSERRTRVSAGYISDIYQNGSTWYIAADLVTVNYQGTDYQSGNRSTFINDSTYLYRYAVAPHCIFYAVQNGVVRRCTDLFAFGNIWSPDRGKMFRIVYIEDEIVAILPYQNDY